MAKKQDYSNAFSRVFQKTQASETMPEKVEKSPETTPNELYEVNDTTAYEMALIQDAIEKSEQKPVKKLTSKPVEKRSVKGFKLTEKTQKTIGIIAQIQRKKEYEILEEALEVFLTQNPEIQKIIKAL